MRRKKLTKRQWLWEFSKKIVVIVTFIYVAVTAFSCVCLWFNPDSTAVPTIIESLSDVFKITVVSYAVKAGFENVVKIKKQENNDYE